MSDKPLKSPEVWVLLVVGVLWLALGARDDLLFLLVACVPGVALIAGGAGVVLAPGLRRMTETAAFGGVAGVLLSVPALVIAGLGDGLLLFLASAAAALAAGRLAMTMTVWEPEVPRTDRGLVTAAEMAVDEAAIGLLASQIGLFVKGGQPEAGRRLDAALEFYEGRGWLDDAAAAHPEPPALESASVRTERGIEFISFESGYEPPEGAPGRDAYLSFEPNRTGWARVLRRRGSQRWAVCVHGLGMGWTPADIWLLQARWFHDALDCNVILPVLPLHGRRRIGPSGAGFAQGDTTATVYATSQAVWDIRRLIGWARREGAGSVGLHSVSLGSYVSALVSSLDGAPDVAVLGVPAVDLATLSWLHGSRQALTLAEAHGITLARCQRLYRMISPLALTPRVAAEGRHIYAAIHDGFVPQAQPLSLARHWALEDLHWYPGSHLGIPFHDGVRLLITEAMSRRTEATPDARGAAGP